MVYCGDFALSRYRNTCGWVFWSLMDAFFILLFSSLMRLPIQPALVCYVLTKVIARMVMSSPPHPLMHFGMAGWFHIRNQPTTHYRPDKAQPSPEWPPKYWKFHLATRDGPNKCEAAFVDFRRFARIRLLDYAADDIRTVSPLKENGPDPVQDKDILTEEWLAQKLKSKHVPVKALLLDQANISGIGNWVGDELLYDARIHPEQYSNTLSEVQVKRLHTSMMYVCGFAVEHLADSTKFPQEWLFKHRWGKGKKDKQNVLPNGARFVYLTVGKYTFVEYTVGWLGLCASCCKGVALVLSH